MAGLETKGQNDMEAKITEKGRRNAKQMPGKELVNSWQVVALHKGKLEQPVRAVCWMARSNNASVVYASVWVHGRNGLECSGHGSAGGGGYDKESAAVQDAITSAGIELYGSAYANSEGMTVEHDGSGQRGWVPEDTTRRTSIDGVGERAVRSALEAITRAAGFRGQAVIV